jgi:hypothetical protein
MTTRLRPAARAAGDARAEQSLFDLGYLWASRDYADGERHAR